MHYYVHIADTLGFHHVFWNQKKLKFSALSKATRTVFEQVIFYMKVCKKSFARKYVRTVFFTESHNSRQMHHLEVIMCPLVWSTHEILWDYGTATPYSMAVKEARNSF